MPPVNPLHLRETPTYLGAAVLVAPMILSPVRWQHAKNTGGIATAGAITFALTDPHTADKAREMIPDSPPMEWRFNRCQRQSGA